MAKKSKKSSAKKSPKKSAKKPTRVVAKKAAKKSPASKAPTIRRGDLFWTELNTSNPGAALKFYQKLLGWTNTPMAMGPDMTYDVLVQNGKQFGGVAQTQDPAAPSMWLSYFWVDNVDQATETAKGLGGTVLMAPFDIPGTGRMVILKDPTGASFALMKAIPPKP